MLNRTCCRSLALSTLVIIGCILNVALIIPVHAAPVRNADQERRDTTSTVGHPTFVSPHARPIALAGDRVFVVNTPADTVDVIDVNSSAIVNRIPVGVDPVGIAVRPDGLEVWVSNHVSDSVNVINNDPNSPSFLSVISTIQSFDENRATTFDEPVGIAFANNDKAYVALSSENQIAVIDVASRRIMKRLTIPAQDPRAIVVRNGKLYVLPFESNNKTQLSGGNKDTIDGKLITFDAWEHSVFHNNVLSIGHVVDIVKHPDVPDRDLFIFNTETDELQQTIDSLGTLLYGITVASDGTVFIAQTDARNHINGRAGTKGHSLRQLENRAFLNQITRVTSAATSVSAVERRLFDLEPLPPAHPQRGLALATPYAIQISEDDKTLVATAAASHQLFTADATTGAVLGRVEVGFVPRGVALHHREGLLSSAWVLNAAANSVSHVDLTDATAPRVVSTIELDDPTHPIVKRGRIAFESASASSTGTFSCASCHPDGHTDQLLWVLKTPVVTGGDQIMPRSTMPVRGLRDTEPYHWDGIPGDPYGGNNSANVHGNDPPNSVAGDPTSSIRHLIDGGLASTMAFADETSKNDEGKLGRLSSAERDAMASFLLSVPYPPAQRRPYDGKVTNRARRGFELFHLVGDDDPTKPQANVCGDCHRMPHLVSTNTPGTGMDAPTWRGAYDRFLILPQGRLNIMEFDFFARVANEGTPEQKLWQFSWGGRERFNPVWDMVLEMSTGYASAFARQVTLNKHTVNDTTTIDLLNELERAALEGAVVLEGNGVSINNEASNPIHLQLNREREYYPTDGIASFTREHLLREVENGRLIVTLTAHHGEHCDVEHPQPVIWTVGPIEKQRGRQDFPVLYPDQSAMEVSGRHIARQARVFLDGRHVNGSVDILKNERLIVNLDERPQDGLHLLQLQNPGGQFSNDFIVTVSQTQPTTDDKPAQDKPKTLAEALERAGWDALVGEWVDEATKGDSLKLSFKWKIDQRVLVSESVDPARTSFAMISVNAANGDVFQVGADSTGSSHLGTWQFNENGEAVVMLGYTDGEGKQGQITLRYQLTDDNTLTLGLSLPQAFQIRLKRVQE